MIVFSEDMVSRLENIKDKMKRKEDLSPFVEWICELFLIGSIRREEVPEVRVTRVRRQVSVEQRKAG